MKKVLLTSMLALGLAAFAAPAFATPPEDTTCTSACIPDGVDTTMRQFTLSGAAMFGGYGAAVFEGQDGYAVTEKLGEGSVEITSNLAGGFCEDVDCPDGDFTFKGKAVEQVTAGAGAMSEQSGLPAMVWNEGAAAAGLQFSYGRSTFAPPGD